MTAVLELPDSAAWVPADPDVCHRGAPGVVPIAGVPAETMCGAIVEDGECCTNGESCGRPPCPMCELAMEGPWSG